MKDVDGVWVDVPDSVEVRWCSWGVIELVENVLFLNEGLKNPAWMRLRGWLVNGLFNSKSDDSASVVKDFANFFNQDRLDLWHFVLRHPKAWVGFLPVSYRGGFGWLVDWSHLVMDAVFVALLIFGLWWFKGWLY